MAFQLGHHVLFTFPNPLPTAAGLVWTDGAVGSGTTFEAFGPGMVSLGTIGPVMLADGGYNGTTAEDRFFGVQDEAGILAIKVTHPGGQIEVDHVMFGSSGGAPPPAPTCAYTFSKGGGAALVEYCLTEQGTVVTLEAPAGQEHVGNGEVWEGYIVCVWAGGANAVALTATSWTFATDTAVDTGTAPACSATSGSMPATTSDARLANVTQRVGNMSPGAKKKATFVYRIE